MLHMKHIFGLLYILLCSLPVIGQSTKVVELSFNASDFDIVEENGLAYITSSTVPFILDSDTLLPALPYINVYVVVGNESEYSGHTISSNEYTIRNNVTLAPNPKAMPTNVAMSQAVRQIATYGNSYYPSQAIEYKGTHVFGGYKVLGFMVCPFSYDAINGTLYLKTSITLNISLGTQIQNSPLIINPNMTEFVQQLTINGQEISTLYGNPSLSRGMRVQPSDNSDYSYEYIIVTCDSLKSVFQQLADWKTKKGVRAKVITVEDIYNEYSSKPTPQLKIKQALKDYYDESDHTLQYVLLGGDTEIVPAQKCQVKSHYEYDPIAHNSYFKYVEHLASDLFYASFANMNWDTNNDGEVGTVNDFIQLCHNIIVTRLSVNSLYDAYCQINRIINYESNPITNNWEDKYLLSGRSLNNVEYGDDRLTDVCIKSERDLYPYIRDYWPNASKHSFYDSWTTFEGGRAYQFRVNNLQEQLSNGYTFINVTTHGEPDNWLMEWRIDQPDPLQLYYASHAYLFQNPRNSIITTTACLTNAFDSISTSLSEAFMRNPNSGILAYYGCTHYGWYFSDTASVNPSMDYVRLFYKKLLTDRRHQLGRAVYDSKASFINDCYNNDYFRWLMLGMNILCDPEMSIYLSQPMTFNNVSISKEWSTLSVVTGVSDCKVTVSSYPMDNEVYFEYKDSVSSTQFNLPSGRYHVCVTKQGYVPYVTDINMDNFVYIQNENFDTDVDIQGSFISVGSDVTTQKPQGPVTISDGKTILRCKDNVTITKDFEVVLGAELEISGTD